MHYDIEFKSHNDTCAGRLYVPDGERRARAIVLAHGLCGTADSGLYEMAEGFAQNGFHALVFDYRNFGKSGGNKRQHISVPMQREDWQAALVPSDRARLHGHALDVHPGISCSRTKWVHRC